MSVVQTSAGATSVQPPGSRVQLKDEAAAHIRELIVSGQVQPGELMRLSPLAERVGASVTPVREALLLLAQDGWVTQEPNRGFRVSRITRRDVADAYWVHAQVAGELAARAAVDIDDATIAELRAIDARINAQGDEDEGLLEESNFALHHAIYAVAGSPRLAWFIGASSRFVPRRFWGMIPGWLEHNRNGHTEILSALAAHDAERSRAAMAAHISAARDLLLAYLDSISFWQPEEPS
jgi:DNA-binding GntR family transcriptional regulator